MTAPETDRSLSAAVQRFFAEDNWTTAQVGDAVLQMTFRGENGQWMCFAQAREELRQFIFYSVCPVTIGADKRLAIAEFITRANYGLIIGNFELDFEDGELRYKPSLDVEAADLTPGLIRPVVYANVITMDRYLPGALAILYGNTLPEEAITRAEND